MSKLPLFNKIDDTINILKENSEYYNAIRKELCLYFNDCLNEYNCLLSIPSRIKSADSLKEKIIRNQLYLQYDTAQDIIDHLGDLIGVKLECRFDDDESKIFEILKKEFDVLNENGFFASKKYQNVYLDLESEQPQTQRNGFPIYRIDGFYLDGNKRINFELQIKSLVNSFWGDIEHKLVYKNTNYCVYDGFVSDILKTVKENLSIIDKQLKIIFNELDQNDDTPNYESEVDFVVLISKSLNDLFIKKLKESLGFSINLKSTSNIIASFLLRKGDGSYNISDKAFSLLSLFHKLETSKMDFKEVIEFEKPIESNDQFVKIVGEFLRQRMNEDYMWYIFFRILFSIEIGNNSEDFELFLKVFKETLLDEQLLDNCLVNNQDKEEVKNSLEAMLARIICEEGDIRVIENENLEIIKNVFNSWVQENAVRIKNLNDFDIWYTSYYSELKENVKSALKQHSDKI